MVIFFAYQIESDHHYDYNSRQMADIFWQGTAKSAG